MAPSWMMISKAAARGPTNPSAWPTRIRWPVDETGRNSVTPSTSPRMMATMKVCTLRAPPGLLESGEQRVDVPRAVMAHAVDEKRGRPVHAARHPAAKILAHPLRIRPLRQLPREAVDVEPEVPRVLRQAAVLEGELPLEQPIVHLPEFSLHAGRFRRFGGVLGVGVALFQRKIPENEPQAAAHFLLNLLHDRVGTAAVRALVIAILHERDGGVRRPLRVVALAHRQRECRRGVALTHAELRPTARAS